MKVNFDLVRIGNLRRDPIAEQILRENVDKLKKSIRIFLEDQIDIYGYGSIDMIMVIPGSGFNIKILLKDIRDKNLRKVIHDHLPDSIYKGKHSMLMKNLNNRIWV